MVICGFDKGFAGSNQVQSHPRGQEKCIKRLSEQQSPAVREGVVFGGPGEALQGQNQERDMRPRVDGNGLDLVDFACCFIEESREE